MRGEIEVSTPVMVWFEAVPRLVRITSENSWSEARANLRPSSSSWPKEWTTAAPAIFS